MKRAEVAVVIPTYNEAGSIERVIRSVIEAVERRGVSCRIVVVDDNSPDGTSEVVKRLSEEMGCIDLLVRPGRMGIGSAYVHGFRYALEQVEGLRAVVEMDADGSHDPSQLPLLIEPVLSGEADVAVGSRYVAGGSWEGNQAFREFISRGANLLTRVCTGLRVKDSTSGFRTVSSDLLRTCIATLRGSNKGYVFQVESLATYVGFGARVVEVPISFRPRASGKSKLRVRDVVGFAIWNLKFLLGRTLRRSR